MTKVRIFVTYKPSVFDPQGDTIKAAIHSLGHQNVIRVRVGKFFDFVLDVPQNQVEKEVKTIADQLLVNFNMETYTYQIMEEV